MKLEIDQLCMAKDLFAELNVAQYLTLFSDELPILPDRILRPMAKDEGTAHFDELAGLRNNLTAPIIEELLGLARTLPNLDQLLGGFDEARLAQYHLYELGRFLDVDGMLAAKEAPAPLLPVLRPQLDGLQAILRARSGVGYEGIVGDAEADRLRDALATVDTALRVTIEGFERQIAAETGLKMIYPWPRELALTGPETDRLGGCKHLVLEPRGDVWLVGYAPGPELTRLLAERDALTGRLETRMAEQLAAINRELQPFCREFTNYYHGRRYRTWQYLLLAVAKRHGFVLPVFGDEVGGRIVGGYIPGQKAQKKRCVPLDLELDRGASVLFGAHQSGKTTVLKTIFLLLTLVRLGLPVPAQAIRVSYPEQVAIFLKTSGDINRELSAFGAEVVFFTERFQPGAWILADELFLSTDPVNGALLSEIFIRAMAAKEVVFLCTTHYPAILDIEAATLLHMADCPMPGPDESPDLREFLVRMPYRVEKIVGDEARHKVQTGSRPLEIALLFALPEEIKKAIRQQLALRKKD